MQELWSRASEILLLPNSTRGEIRSESSHNVHLIVTAIITKLVFYWRRQFKLFCVEGKQRRAHMAMERIRAQGAETQADAILVAGTHLI